MKPKLEFDGIWFLKENLMVLDRCGKPNRKPPIGPLVHGFLPPISAAGLPVLFRKDAGFSSEVVHLKNYWSAAQSQLSSSESEATSRFNKTSQNPTLHHQCPHPHRQKLTAKPHCFDKPWKVQLKTQGDSSPLPANCTRLLVHQGLKHLLPGW